MVDTGQLSHVVDGAQFVAYRVEYVRLGSDDCAVDYVNLEDYIGRREVEEDIILKSEPRHRAVELHKALEVRGVRRGLDAAAKHHGHGVPVDGGHHVPGRVVEGAIAEVIDSLPYALGRAVFEGVGASARFRLPCNR